MTSKTQRKKHNAAQMEKSAEVVQITMHVSAVGSSVPCSTHGTMVMNFESAKPALASKPLRAPRTGRIELTEDESDAIAFSDAVAEGGTSKSYNTFRRELGLD